MTSRLEATLAWVTMLAALVTLSVEGYTKTERTEDMVEVQLRQGLIYTVREDAGQGRYFYSFKGIPYAKPPVGELRFLDPVPADNWSGSRNGSIAPPLCPQLDDGEVKGSEDCLYLNVYTPAPLTVGLPVMVWIHGGSFQNGGGEQLYPPLPLMTKDIVLVAVQYRLGTLGFLSTGDSVMPGNMGLKDQTLALRWVQDNILDFGGDPAKVTIFGESAGGAAVHFQLLTPMAAGLFRRAILQSGAALCAWALREDHRRVAITLGHHFNCLPVDDWPEDALDSTQLLACLQQVPVKDLFLVTTSFYVWGEWPTVMRPRVDGYYLPDHPAILLKSGLFNKVDIISGVTQHEGATHTIGIILSKELTQAVKQNFTVAGPASLLIEPEEDSHVYLARRVYYHYLGAPEFSQETVKEFTEMISDRYYRVCQEETAQLHAALGSLYGKKVFKYELQHRGQFGFADYYNSSLNKKWVGHADDLQYLFGGDGVGLDPMEDPADLFMRHIILTLWFNFAATGNPTPDGSLGFRWWPTSQSHPWYLALTTSPVMKDNVLIQELEFWKNLPTKMNLLLYPENFLKNGTCPAPAPCSDCC